MRWLRTRAGGGTRRADFKKIGSKTGGATRYTDAADECFRRMADEARQAELPLQDPRREFTNPEEQLFHNMWIFSPQRKKLLALGLNGEYVCLGRFKVKKYTDRKLKLVRVPRRAT